MKASNPKGKQIKVTGVCYRVPKEVKKKRKLTIGKMVIVCAKSAINNCNISKYIKNKADFEEYHFVALFYVLIEIHWKGTTPPIQN